MNGAAPARVRGRKRRAAKRTALVILLLVLVAALVAWTQRTAIVDDVVRDQLEAKGVEGSYTLERVGLRTQRIRDLVIGDPDNPDLTADYVELKTRVSLLGKVSVYRVTARGVRARARLLADGSFSFGQIDRLLPESSGKPFSLPDLSLDIADSQLALTTPYGPVGIAAAGSGNLSGGFAGRVAAASPRLDFGSCAFEAPRLNSAVGVKARRIALEGPLTAAGFNCGDALTLAQPEADLDITLAESLDKLFDSNALLSAQRLDVGGVGIGDLRARLTFDGPFDDLRGQYRLLGETSRARLATVERMDAKGSYRVDIDAGTYLVEGTASARDASIDAALLNDMVDAVNGLRKTPLEPIGDRLARALRRNLSAFGGEMAYRVEQDEDGLEARLTRFEALADAGARLSLDGVLLYEDGAVRMTGPLTLSGGDLPQMQLTLDDPPGPEGLSGRIETSEYRAGNASIDVDALRFAQRRNGSLTFDGRARLSGPFSGGRVEGAELPIRGRINPDGSFVIAEGCTPVAARRVTASGLQLDNVRLSLCGKNGAIVRGSSSGAEIGLTTSNVALRGTLGGNPFALNAASGELVGGEYFQLGGVDVTMGDAGSPVVIEAEEVVGTFSGRGVNGTIGNGAAVIGDIPILMSEVVGIWQVVDGELFLNGEMTVSDRSDPVRFYPLISEQFQMTLIDSVIEASGDLLHPYSGAKIMDVAIRHDLDRSAGEALLSVPGIRFDEDLQPEEITPLTQGVVALVVGNLNGNGRIAWSDAGVESTGTFNIVSADFAAPFGPVTNFNTQINFSDLLNLTTPPGQRLTVDLLNPGIPVATGVATYQLLPGQLVKIERGEWPFMGGQLILQPTVLNFGSESDKRLTFELVGFNSKLFVERLEFDETIKLTGIFDGVIPTIFDDEGGRIVGGRLDARDGGGTIEYVGDFSGLSLGPRLAMSVIRSIGYDKMIVRLDGDLDGEFATRMDIDGVRLGETTAAKIVRQVSDIPINMEVNITGPFRAIIATLQSFDDSQTLIADVLPGRLEDIPGAYIETRRIREERDTEEAPETPETESIPDARKEELP